MMTHVFASLSTFSWSPKWKHDCLLRPPPVQRTSLCLVSSACYQAENFSKVLFRVPPLLCQRRNNFVSLMASMNMQADSSSEKFQWKYDVFLSFRGEDTRTNFTDHLYTTLHQKGVVTYRDDPNLEKGENISNEVLKAIESSKYLVVILSPNYASSTWCLEELAKIVECMKREEQMAIPIFYKVDPSDVRKQRGSFQSAFARHEATFEDDMDKVQRWKNAMKEIASLAGWDLLDRHESHFIRDIVEDLQNKLGKKLFHAPKNLVGIKSRMEDMLSHLSIESNDIRFIGISGMGGIGKSTLARAVFDEISARFEGCSFLANVREVSGTLGLVHLQNKLLFDVLQEKDLVRDVIAGVGIIEERLKHKRVLVVLDDVDQMDQLEYLSGKSWFGSGSRIIMTTRDEHLLLKHGVDAIHKAKELSNEEALELFCFKALEKNNPSDEFAKFSKQVIEYAKGLPLALTVLGSFLFGRTMIQWQSALARLQEIPNKEIFRALRLSFDSLEETEKAIFLDIACFFNGEDIDYVMEKLKYRGFYPEIGVKVLIEKSLLTITGENFSVHDLLQEMAWEVVKQESPQEPGKRSRLWKFDDLNHVMTCNTGTEWIEGIVLKSRGRINLDAVCFNKMTNLRLLIIPNAHFFYEIKYLSNKVRLFIWEDFTSSYLLANFLPESLHELSLRHSYLRRLWRGQKIFQKLKRIDLSYSSHLKEIPNFKIIPNLEKLILRGCSALSQIHPNIGVLQNLKVLDLAFCKNLTKLPDSICSLECLEELNISYTAIAHLPPNLRDLKNLKKLDVHGCEELQALPRLPESIHFVEVGRCMKLNSISNLFIIWTDHNSDVLLFNFLKFLPEDLEISLTQKYSLALLYYFIGCSNLPVIFGEMHVVAPICEIPKWFTYQKGGSLLSFHIRDPRFKYKVSGFAICVSFLRQGQKSSGQKHLKCSHNLICEFKVGKNQLGPSFLFPISFIAPNCMWMGFVSLEWFRHHTNWEEVIDERIDVSLRTLNDQLKVIKYGILPLKERSPPAIDKFIQSASSAPEDLSSIFHELVFQNVDYYFSNSGDNEEIEVHPEFPGDVKICGHRFGIPTDYFHSVISNFLNLALQDAEQRYHPWCEYE